MPGNWVEVLQSWSRKELRDLLEVTGDEFSALLRRKIVACHLETAAGEPITDPALLTSEALDDALRYEVYCWLTARLMTYVIEVQRLGESMRRRLWQGAAGEPSAAQSTGDSPGQNPTQSQESLSNASPSPTP
jgi:hypothetical protein